MRLRPFLAEQDIFSSELINGLSKGAKSHVAVMNKGSLFAFFPTIYRFLV
jgi:hypothetical protein